MLLILQCHRNIQLIPKEVYKNIIPILSQNMGNNYKTFNQKKYKYNKMNLIHSFTSFLSSI